MQTLHEKKFLRNKVSCPPQEFCHDFKCIEHNQNKSCGEKLINEKIDLSVHMEFSGNAKGPFEEHIFGRLGVSSSVSLKSAPRVETRISSSPNYF